MIEDPVKHVLEYIINGAIEIHELRSSGDTSKLNQSILEHRTHIKKYCIENNLDQVEYIRRYMGVVGR